MSAEMTIAGTCEFPFVEALPKRKKAKVESAWGTVQAIREAAAKHGGIVPVGMCAKVLNVHRSRVYQFVEEERLQTVEVDGHLFVTGNSLEEFASVERKNGRPVKKVSDLELVKEAFEGAKEIVK